MPLNIDKRFFSFSRYLFFDVISVKFRTDSTKKLMDFSYAIFEKVATKFDIISSNYLKMYHELVDKEINMVGISQNDQVIIIGCGSLPITAILVASKTNAQVIAIDKDNSAVKEANKYIRNHHLEDRVKIEHADGEFYPLKKFDVIYLSYGMKNKEKIFNIITKNTKKNSRIIFRTVIGSQLENKKHTTELSKWFLVKDSIKSNTLPPAGSYLLLKKQ
jgi:precorrin-6B methylase 2